MGPSRARLAHLASAPFALLAALAAVTVFFAALLLGWATAGTREDLHSASLEPRPAAARPLVVLGSAAPLPDAPPPRRKPAARPRAAKVPAPARTRHPARARPRPAPRASAARPAPIPKLLRGTG